MLMKCPNCSVELTHMGLEGHHGVGVEIDVCWDCQSFWFDKYESLQLSPASTLRLMKWIGERKPGALTPFSGNMPCPRCPSPLVATNDMQRNTRFSYFRCRNGHGRLTRFVEFLREKDFIRPLSPEQIAELREHVQMVNCSHCGAPIDLASASVCTHCGSPLSMLDMKRSQELLAQLETAARPKEIDPALPLTLLKAKRDLEISLGDVGADAGWWRDVSSGGLVHACLGSLASWLTKSGI
jgi:hypothetical protein